ncbi:MAG TPA: D-aminoacylase [Caldilineaceae bacterium]|nr:D-aminoacylase [Caldilineaceae bacterium]
MFDILIRNGTIIDGAQTPRYQADLAIQGDRIVQIGRLDDNSEAHQVLDAAGQIVAPGFVDVHNHSDGWLLKTHHLTSKTLQGFTTEVIMADGISYAPLTPETATDWIYYLRTLNALRLEEYSGWETLAEYMALLDGANVQNSIPHIPYANLRTLACGWGRQPPDDFQMRQIIAEVEKGMAAGAVGLSTGMDYVTQQFAGTEELVEVCRVMRAQQGLYVSHVRYKKGTLAGVQEAVEIGRRAGVPVHISHLKGTSPAEIDALLHYIDTIAVNEVDFSFDVYPYLPGSTMLNYLLPYEVWVDGPLGVLPKLRDRQIRERFAQSLAFTPLDETFIAWLPSKENSHHQGKTLGQYVRDSGKAAADALCDLLIEENLTVLLVFHQGDDRLIDPFLQHRCYMMGSDGIYHEDGAVHPRQYGSGVRLIGRCVRDWKLFSLEDAVYKLSGHPAARFGLRQRGRLKEGNFADLVIFDAATVTDHATYLAPHQRATGVNTVIVNGRPIVLQGEPVTELAGPYPGRALCFKA